MEVKILSPKPNSNSNKGLRSHFDRAVDLLGQKAALAADITEWRDQAQSDGLDAAVIGAVLDRIIGDASS
jgi:hypothetical protein